MATGKQTEIVISLSFLISRCTALWNSLTFLSSKFRPVLTTRCALCPTTTSFPAKRTTAKIHTDDVLQPRSG